VDEEILVKVCILAIDGLEYNLAVQWKLKNLLQTTYGKIELTPEYYHKSENVPITPKVWAGFITGKKPSVHGINKFWTYGKLEKIRNLPLIRNLKGKRKLLWRIGIKPRILDRQDLKTKTIFDIVKPSIALDVPTYNLPTETQFAFRKAITLHGIEAFIKCAWETFEKRRQTFLEKLDSNWKLLMAYFSLLDALGHVCIKKKPEELLKAYKTIDKLAEETKNRLNEQHICLIVSDHGMKLSEDGISGTHSNHAFWSLNIETDWKPKDITDFHPKIIKWTENRKI